MASKEEKRLAYEAGRVALSEPPERRSVSACPFAVGTDERGEWLRGFEDELNDAPPVTDLKAELAAARKEQSA